MFALTLARAGHAVTLLEKTREPHDKVCGEFLSRESAVYLERHGLHPEKLGAVPIDTVRLVTPWFTQERALPFPAWSLTRKRLDEALLVEAQRSGVQVLRGAQVTALTRADNSWRVTVRDREAFTASDVVLATGKLDVGGWPRPEGRQPDLIAFKMYYRLSSDQLAKLGSSVELVLFPGGYAGLQPVGDGVANLCLLVDRRRLQTGGTEALQEVIQRSPHLQQRLYSSVALLQKPLAASRIPYGHLQRATLPGLWRVGDQAAVIPSFCGDGTAIALHSGAVAAAAFLNGASAYTYQQKLHGQLATRMGFAARLSQLLVDWPEASYVLRAFPGLMSAIAALTRIPESALGRASAAAGRS